MKNPGTTLDAQINARRTADVTLTVLGADRTPLANREVEVTQRKHQFLFGCIGFDQIPLANGELDGEEIRFAEEYSQRLLDLCN